MVKSKRLNRTTDMDDALFEALKTQVPHKDTGPDPDDILAGLFDDDDEKDADQSELNIRDSRASAIELDDIDRERVEQIVQLIRNQTGEQIDAADAIRIALFLCPLDEQEIHMAFKMIGPRKGK